MSLLLVTLTLCLSAITLGVGFAGSAAASEIDECGTIDSSGTYTLNSSVTTATSGTCLEIAASDVTLDGQNKTITMTASGDGVTIASTGSIENVTVKHLEIAGGDNGIVVETPGEDVAVDVVLEQNVVTDTNEDGMAFRIHGLNSDASIEITDNEFDTNDDAIGDVEVDGGGSSVKLSIRNNTITSGNRGIDNVDANDANQAVDLEIVDNDITAEDDGIYGIELYGDGSVHTVSVSDNHIIANGGDGLSFIESGGGNHQQVDVRVTDNDITATEDGIGELVTGGTETNGSLTVKNNEIDSTGVGINAINAESTNQTLTIKGNNVTAETYGFEEIDAGQDNSSVDATIDNNTLSAGTSGIDEFSIDGTNQSVDLRVRDNRIDGFSTTGIGLEVQLIEATRFDASVSNNHIESDLASPVGIRIEPDDGSGGLLGTLAIEGNDVMVNGHAIVVESGPVAGIGIHHNALDASGFGVKNMNTTGSTYVNATGNYWSADDGPGSTGSLEDPVTGALANGTGSDVSEGGTTNISNVHFDPWLERVPSANVQVSIDSTNSPVTEGDTLDVTASIENTGEELTTENVKLTVNGSIRDASDVTINRGESQIVSLSWSTSAGDAGDYNATVASEGDSATKLITVEKSSSSGNASTPVIHLPSIDIDEGTEEPVSASIDGPMKDGEIVLLSAENQTIRGSSTLSAGDQLSVTWRSTGPQPFLRTQTVPVASDGDWTATTDLSGVPDGQAFTVTIRREKTLDSANGTVVEPASVSMSSQLSQNGQVLTVDSAFLPAGGFVSIHDTSLLNGSTQRSSRGASKYLPPGAHNDIQVTLDQPVNASQTVIAMVHRDTNGNAIYDFLTSNAAEDHPYEVAGDPVTDDATLMLPTPTTTTTTTTTTLTTTTRTTRTTTTLTTTTTTTTTLTTATTTEADGSASTPGFGPVATLIALLLTALHAIRRR